MHAAPLRFTLPWGQGLHCAHMFFRFPWGQGLHIAQPYFTLPWGQGLHSAHSIFSLPCEHRLFPILRAPRNPLRARFCGHRKRRSRGFSPTFCLFRGRRRLSFSRSAQNEKSQSPRLTCPAGMEIHAFRLTPGQDLRKSLVSYAKGAKLEAGCVLTCVGSLQKVSLRLANADSSTSTHNPKGNETVSLDERFEIVSLTGTVSRHGCHLHISLADYQGNVVGGHLLDGCVVFTTAELVLGECVGHVFSREMDEETGFDELVVTTKLAPVPVTKRIRNGYGNGSNNSSFDSEIRKTGVGQAVVGGVANAGASPRKTKIENGDSESEEERKPPGFFGWLGRAIAPPPPGKYATTPSV